MQNLPFLPGTYEILSLRHPVAWEVFVFGFCVRVVKNLHEAGKIGKSSGAGTFLWQLLIALCAACGGGILIPILLSHDNFFPFPLAADNVIPYMFGAIILVGYFPGDMFVAAMDLAPLRFLSWIGFEMVRSRLVCVWSQRAFDVVPPSYAVVPVFAPIVCGALGGCGGFLLINGIGKDSIQTSIPWPVESAFLASLVYFFTNSASEFGLRSFDQTDPQMCVLGALVLARFVPILRQLLPWRFLKAIGSSLFGENNAVIGEKDHQE